MTDAGGLPARLAPAAVVLLLAAALVLGTGLPLRLESPPGGPADELVAALEDLPSDSLVLIGFDPDLGTYAEIRPTVRALLADLLDRGARIALVSLTSEGRALALAEADRLRDLGVDPARVVDLGFVPGAEAGLVALSVALNPAPPPGLGRALGEPLGDERPELVVVVGGNDLGPRSWVEQVAPRVDGVELAAVAPAVLLPELRPYLASGQLTALIGTPRDGAAYRATVDVGRAADGVPEAGASTALAVGVGLLVALAWIGSGLLGRVGGTLRGRGAGETP